MRRRDPLFVTVLILTATALTTPYVAAGTYLGWIIYQNGGQLPFELIGVTPTISEWSDLSIATIAGDRIYWNQYVGANAVTNDDKFIVRSVDPETGSGLEESESKATRFETHLTSAENMLGTLQFASDGKRLWIVGRFPPGRVIEHDGGRFIERQMKQPDKPPEDESEEMAGSIQPFSVSISCSFGNWNNFGAPLRPNSPFFRDGKLTIIAESDEGGSRELLQFVDDQWQSLGEIVVLDTTRGWKNSDGKTLFDAQPQRIATSPPNFEFDSLKGAPTFDGIPAPVSASGLIAGTTLRPEPGQLRLLQCGSTSHLFWQVSNRLLYRNGIPLSPKQEGTSDSHRNGQTLCEPLSAQEPTNVVGVCDDWSFVTEIGEPWADVAVSGDPVIVLIRWKTSEETGYTTTTRARALRLEGHQWKEFASTDLPYASQTCAVGCRDDQSISYLCSASSLGRWRVVAIEPTGFRLTSFDHLPIPRGVDGYIVAPMALGSSLIAGLILTLVVTFLMRRDSARFEFAHQSVELASAFERGLARFIDLTFLFSVAVAMFGALAMIHKFDWWTALEAVNVRDLTNPAVVAIVQSLSVSAVVAAAVKLVLIFTQAYVATPGKWLCGLRTLRTTLKPCGFARSLAREVMLCIDSMNLLYWTPGILAIAFTESRQRLGDLVADTIVIRSKSLR